MNNFVVGNKLLFHNGNSDIYRGIVTKIRTDGKFEVRIEHGINPDDRPANAISPNLLVIKKTQIILSVTPNVNYTLKQAFHHQFKQLIFRRVSSCYVKPEALIKKEQIILNADGTVNSKTVNGDNFSRAFYSSYYGYTAPLVLRGNDTHPGESIYFSSEKECDLNEYGILMNLTKQNKGEPPALGSLIAGYPSPGPPLGHKTTPYQRWFKCSEQFYKLWTLLIYEDHPIKFKLSPHRILSQLSTCNLQEDLKRITNGYQKKLTIEQYAEYVNKLYLIKTESWSRIPFFYQYLCQRLIFPDEEVNMNSLTKENKMIIEKIVKNLQWMNFKVTAAEPSSCPELQ